MQTATAPSGPSSGDFEPRRWIPLVLLLLALTGLDPLSIPAVGFVSEAARSLGSDRPEAVPILRVASYVGTGWLIDRFGARRVIALSLCAWASTASLGCLAEGPLALTALHWAMTMSRSATWIAGVVAVGVAVPSGWRALAIAALFLAGRAWEIEGFGYRLAVYRAEDYDVDSIRTMLLLIAGTAGSLAAALWLILVRGGDEARDATDADPLGSRIRPLAWLVAADLCGTFAFRAAEVPALHLARSRLAHSAIGYDALRSWADIAALSALIGASLWSDAAVRSGVSCRDARRRPILAGLLVAASLAVAPAIPEPQSLSLVLVAATAGASVTMLTTPALVDASPPGATGRVLGTAAALSAVVTYAADRLIALAAPAGSVDVLLLVFGGAASLAGAGAAAAAFRSSSPRP